MPKAQTPSEHVDPVQGPVVKQPVASTDGTDPARGVNMKVPPKPQGEPTTEAAKLAASMGLSMSDGNVARKNLNDVVSEPKKVELIKGLKVENQ